MNDDRHSLCRRNDVRALQGAAPYPFNLGRANGLIGGDIAPSRAPASRGEGMLRRCSRRCRPVAPSTNAVFQHVPHANSLQWTQDAAIVDEKELKLSNRR